MRVIETATSVILVPLTDAPMSQELRRELDQWQSLAAQCWNAVQIPSTISAFGCGS